MWQVRRGRGHEQSLDVAGAEAARAGGPPLSKPPLTSPPALAAGVRALVYGSLLGAIGLAAAVTWATRR